MSGKIIRQRAETGGGAAKAILMSLRPEYWELIRKGIKTIELRKRVPSIQPPYTVYLYVTSRSVFSEDKLLGKTYYHGSFYGKVMGEFICDQVFDYVRLGTCRSDIRYTISDDHLAATGLSYEKLEAYGDGKPLHGLNISDLKIYDEPKELRDFCYPPETYCEKGLCSGCPYDQAPNEYNEYSYDCEWHRPIKRPPQSWCYVEELS